MIEKGLFICIEGIDGVGKTTLGALLAQWFGERGFPCVFSKEPTGIGAGAALRQSAVTGRKTLEEELALFLQDRRDHVERTIAPALQRGNAVILDRCYWSNAAYQGVRGGDWKKILADNESFVPRPDLVLLLDADPEQSLERIRKRGDHANAFEDHEELKAIRQIFLKIQAQSEQGVLIDASLGFKEVFQLALTEVKVLLKKKMELVQS